MDYCPFYEYKQKEEGDEDVNLIEEVFSYMYIYINRMEFVFDVLRRKKYL